MHHWHSFIDAVRGEAPSPSANFGYSGPLTETVLLGGIATRVPQAGTNLGRTQSVLQGQPQSDRSR